VWSDPTWIMNCAWRTSNFPSWTALVISTRISNPWFPSLNTVPYSQLVYTAHSHASCHDVLYLALDVNSPSVCKNAIWRTGIWARVRALVVAVDVTDKSLSDYVIGRGGERWWGQIYHTTCNLQFLSIRRATCGIELQ